jgi:hypothetical protein
MRPLALWPIILAMTRPSATAKLLLVEDSRGLSAAGGPAPVRRYRLARLRVDPRAAEAQDRFEHLRRAHD